MRGWFLHIDRARFRGVSVTAYVPDSHLGTSHQQFVLTGAVPFSG